MAAIPQVFRVTLHVRGLEESQTFYSKLLGAQGRMIGGGRCYFDCGPVILALLDAKLGRQKFRPNPKSLYFAVENIKTIHARAKRLRCLADEDVHGASAGAIVTRPWGERSFYAEDPSGNSLCFVEASTVFTGKR